MKRNYIYIILIVFLAAANSVEAADSVWWKLPELPRPDNYGNILIDRVSSSSGVKPVGFSHWSHRVKYTCRVCHFELEFNMMLNTTEITEEQNRYGRYCGACHNNKIAFGHTKENCDKCHNGDISYGKEKFDTLSGLPLAINGNGIDWVKALNDEQIKPENYVLEEIAPIDFTREIVIEPPWAGIAPVIFPHDTHGKWLYCSNCHPEIFQIKQYGTEELAMESILNYEFCGVCHGRVAFPPNDNCKRCHPSMKHQGKTGSDRH
jgi:c(7)-type cytochrome triheme protein